MSKIVFYLSKEQVEEIEKLVNKWDKRTDEIIKECIGMALTDVPETRFKSYNVSLRDCLAWLEKQVNDKEQINLPHFTFDDVLALQCCMETVKKVQEDKDLYEKLKDLHGRVYDAYHLEKQGEQKSTNKVEPKFKAGDWVVDNCGYVWKIEGILNQFYLLEGIEGGESRPTIEWVNNTFHHWSIQDAKDGDVLCDSHEAYDNPLIFILKKFEHVNFGLVTPSDYSSYCFLTAGDKQRFKEGTYHHKHNIKPAAKEQRDLLFQKMKEAGYEWDAESKELNKFEDEEYNDEDYGIDGLYHAQRILEKTLGKVDGYQTDDGILSHQCAITAVKKLYEQKSAEWSKEDEDYYDAIIAKLEVTQDDAALTDNQMEFLKSLKQRYTWKPSEEQMRALHDMNLTGNISYAGQGQTLIELYNDLKKL